MMPISAVIITLNEEKNIERCLQSLIGIVDDVVVLDSFSSDKTQEICEKYGARFFQHRFDTYGDQKDRALRLAKYDYILSIDADEALDEVLKNSILKAKSNLLEDAYYVSRLTNYCGHWVRYGAWYPDRKLRLFNRTKGEWINRTLHEEWKLYEAKSISLLEGHLLHYSFPDLKAHYQKIELYSKIASKQVSIFKVILNPMWCFFVGFFLKRGFLDGKAGFNIARLSAFSVYLKYKWKNIN